MQVNHPDKEGDPEVQKRFDIAYGALTKTKAVNEFEFEEGDELAMTVHELRAARQLIKKLTREIRSRLKELDEKLKEDLRRIHEEMAYLVIERAGVQAARKTPRWQFCELTFSKNHPDKGASTEKQKEINGHYAAIMKGHGVDEQELQWEKFDEEMARLRAKAGESAAKLEAFIQASDEEFEASLEEADEYLAYVVIGKAAVQKAIDAYVDLTLPPPKPDSPTQPQSRLLTMNSLRKSTL
ncbi:unnamed protein product [Vitrella brassicaformis CCMP3155]|uniref:J domain-containing protein n=1 Tax=Vitrella brassicaformis (strain CCMP3155) TaxID=1169540 RepID=A0A0G4EPM3_VITBC|nr:unnamed protein product [Vitrella brassicaformis CCMP3155]|eukprot:CEL99210.1 unnamed protein product [Vitrella brassicaformis CCMP3155]